MAKRNQTLSLEQLATLTGVPARTIRYYIARGLLDRPQGEKRGAYYEPRHAEQLAAIRRWQESGLSLERVAELLQRSAAPTFPLPRPGSVSVVSRVHLQAGVELVIDPALSQLTPQAVARLGRALLETLQAINAEQT